MRYLLLIYQEEGTGPEPGTPEADLQFARYMEFTESINATGRNRGGEALQPVSTATTVRVRGGDVLVTDGPFAETKEQLGGFYMVEADDLDEAIEMARRIPAAEAGCIEVRPVWEWSEPGD